MYGWQGLQDSLVWKCKQQLNFQTLSSIILYHPPYTTIQVVLSISDRWQVHRRSPGCAEKCINTLLHTTWQQLKHSKEEKKTNITHSNMSLWPCSDVRWNIRKYTKTAAWPTWCQLRQERVKEFRSQTGLGNVGGESERVTPPSTATAEVVFNKPLNPSLLQWSGSTTNSR